MQKKSKQTGIVWFRNDLRVRDQEALYRASEECEHVIGLYCFDPIQFGKTNFGFPKTGPFRAKFLLESVANLRKNLESLGIPLVIRVADPAVSIIELTASLKVDSLYATASITDEEKRAEQAVLASLPHSVSSFLFPTDFLIHPDDLPYDLEALPEVFTAFRKTVEKRVGIREPFPIPNARFFPNILPVEQGNIPRLKDLGILGATPNERSAFPFAGGESRGWARINDYFWKTHGIATYKQTRNGLIGSDYSSKFSPWLANGCLSARSIWYEVKRYEREIKRNSSTYWMVFELLWREYFRYISLKWENRIFQAGGIKGNILPVDQDDESFHKWCTGTTGQPFIDANMRELRLTGWMSNRGRQNVASYLVKDLKQDWRKGASWFESLLLDYDPCSNWCNWIYVAGVGNDPRENRYFNPRVQAERYDPEGKFVELWKI